VRLQRRKSDVVGEDPRLVQLRSYGAPPPTEALQPGSPAISAGGICLAAGKQHC
jgi:hypothetical protein